MHWLEDLDGQPVSSHSSFSVPAHQFPTAFSTPRIDSILEAMDRSRALAPLHVRREEAPLKPAKRKSRRRRSSPAAVAAADDKPTILDPPLKMPDTQGPHESPVIIPDPISDRLQAIEHLLSGLVKQPDDASAAPVAAPAPQSSPPTPKTVPSGDTAPASSDVLVAVCGPYIYGLALNALLLQLGASFISERLTSHNYKMYTLHTCSPHV
jgi:hypothetical protein